ncbi:hypothetical protein [Arvimicrobium flavum]|uniref:hypothetical protein n=1 Tax=Arvimicrobium flavum TaxID=3393320 RepID=UPI00237C3599|nr:hypothetical protein [Mesorhizobium shangrilense]
MSDFYHSLDNANPINEAIYHDVGSRGNAAINGNHAAPFAEILRMYEESGVPKADLERILELAIANSSAISYLHLGKPETILIDLPDRIEPQLQHMVDGGEE